MQAQMQDHKNGLADTNGHRSDEPAYPELFQPINDRQLRDHEPDRDGRR